MSDDKIIKNKQIGAGWWVKAVLFLLKILLDGWGDEWVGEWMGGGREGWIGLKAVLVIGYSNQKHDILQDNELQCAFSQTQTEGTFLVNLN